MSLLADTGWERRWLEPLLECGPVTFLMDRNPFDHFEHWASLGLHVRYATVEARSGTDNRIGFACICRNPAEPSYERATFLMVCSDLQADALTAVLQHRWPQMAHEDPDAIRGRLDTVRIVLTHLISEETYFTFESVGPRVTIGRQSMSVHAGLSPRQSQPYLRK
jgi:hypothetical protein